MSDIRNLKDLIEKYRENGYRLSKQDSRKARDILFVLLKDKEMWATVIDFIIDFPSDIGIAAYVSYYKIVDSHQQRQLNKSFVNSDRFQENKNYIGVKRGAVLLNKLIFEDAVNKELHFILKHINKLILRDAGTEINDERQRELLEVFDFNGKLNKQKELESLKAEIESDRKKVVKLREIINGLETDIEKLRGLRKKLHHML